MTLNFKVNPDEICEHLKEVIQIMIQHGITMSHDFEGTHLNCGKCDCMIALEGYDSEFTDEDIGD